MSWIFIIEILFELWDVAESADSDLTANAFQHHKPASAILSLLGGLKGLFLIQVSPKRALRNSDWRIQAEAEDLCKIHSELQ